MGHKVEVDRKPVLWLSYLRVCASAKPGCKCESNSTCRFLPDWLLDGIRYSYIDFSVRLVSLVQKCT